MIKNALALVFVPLAVSANIAGAQGRHQPFFTQAPIYAPAPQYNRFVTPQAPGYSVAPLQQWAPPRVSVYGAYQTYGFAQNMGIGMTRGLGAVIGEGVGVGIGFPAAVYFFNVPHAY